MDHPDGAQDLAPQVDSLVRGVCLYWTPWVRLMLCRKRRAPRTTVLAGAVIVAAQGCGSSLLLRSRAGGRYGWWGPAWSA